MPPPKGARIFQGNKADPTPYLMAVAYVSSRGPSYRVSTRYFCAKAGEGRW
jgi:hypothetical protein